MSRRGIRPLVLVLCVLIIALARGTAATRCDAAESRGAVPTLAEVTRVTEERNGRLDSLFVSYRIKSRVLGSPADANRYLRVVALVDEVKSFGFKGTKRFAQLRPLAEHYLDVDLAPGGSLKKPTAAGPDPSADPLTKGVDRAKRSEAKGGTPSVQGGTAQAFNGESLQRWHPDEKRMHLMGQSYTSAQPDDRAYFNQEYLWLVFHSLPDTWNAKVDRAEHRLPDALSRLKARLRPELESVDGAPCVVIELTDGVVLWCDPKLGYAVRKWESRSPRGDYVLERYQSGDFAEVSPAMWLPRRCTRTHWAPVNAPEAAKRGPLMEWSYEVLELHANDVPDATFALEIPAGALVVDNVHSVKDKDGVQLATNYRMPADRTQLEATVQQAQESMESLLASDGGPMWQPTALWRWLFVLFGLLLIGGIVAYCLIPRRHAQA